MTEVASLLGAPRIAVVGLVLDDDGAQEMERMRLIYTWALRAGNLTRPAEPEFSAVPRAGLTEA